MKSFYLALLFLFSSSSVFAQSALQGFLDKVYNSSEYARTVITSAELSQYKTNVKDIYKAASGQSGAEAQSEYDGFTPRDLYTEYYGIAETLYLEGFVKKQYFQKFLDDYAILLTTSVPNGTDPVQFWEQKYDQLFNSFFDRVKADPAKCVGAGEVATANKCCNGLVKFTSTASSNFPGKKSGEACFNQDDCASKACLKDDPTKPGKCLSVKQCYSLVPLNGACDPVNNPYCERGSCIGVDEESAGVNACKLTNNSCSSDNECCSGSCKSNKCVQVYKCLDCVKGNQVPEQGQTCCPGYYLNSKGKCKLNLPPMVPVTGEIKSRSLLQKIADFIIPSAYAEEPEFTQGQQELLDRKKSQCNGMVGTSKEKCLEELSRMGTGYSRDNTPTLNQAQVEIIAAERNKCTKEYPAASVSHSECMAEVDKKQKELLKENEDKCGKAKPNDAQYEQCIGGIDSEADLINKEKAPLVTAKTYSDVKKCEFNSFNDNWRDASMLERNAELFLRAFEATFSGGGTQDFWQDKEKGNIFSRANKVAKKFRENRQKMISELIKIDEKMTCKCIATYGPEQFDSMKQAYFDQNCEEEKALLGTNLNVNTEKNINNQTGKEEEVAKTSMTTINNANKKAEAAVETVDKGATGISHERMLIEWLGLRRDAQMARFVDNSDLEKELTELSEYVGEVDFEEVWKDELKNEGKTLQKHDPEGDNVLLYRFGVKYLKGWVKLFLIVVMVSLGALWGTGVIFGSSGLFGAGVWGGIAGGLIGGSVGFLAAGLVGSYGSKGTPGVGDLQNFKKKSYSMFKNWDGYERYYLGPKFDNKSTKPETRCDIKAQASACLKSAYQYQLKDMKYLDELNGRYHFIVDPKYPLYLPEKAIAIETMPKLNATWMKIMNDTRDEGVAYLLSTKPGGGTKSRGGKQYIVKGTGYLKRDVFQEAIEKNYFIPFRGNFTPQQWTPGMKNLIIDAVAKYAMCKEMKDNTEDSTCNIVDGKETDIGFGYLFESAAEAKEFAIYTYEMHYVYSSITKSDSMGYPLLAIEAYFAAAAYNMKLVGSLAAARTNKYAEAYGLYVADWEKRVGEYKSLGEGEMGLESRNVKYSKRFYDLFGTLSFDGQTNIEQFNAQLNSANSSKAFNKAELTALAAGKAHAIRVNKDIDKRKAYNKATSNLKGNNLRVERASKSIARLNSPLSSFGMKKLGGVGFGHLKGALSDINKNLKGLSKDLNRKRKTETASIPRNNFSIPNYRSSYRPPSTGSDNDSSSSNINDTGMSGTEVNRILKNLKKDKSLKEVDEDDSIFAIVSKAYKRNYSRVLRRSEVKNEGVSMEKEKVIEKSKKQELKQLLGE